jgi:hypothetical protein
MRFAQEVAPGVAEDQARILGYRHKVKTPAGTFRKALAVRETSPLDSSVSLKLYAPGVGLIRDGDLKLVSALHRAELATVGRAPYLILEPGYTLTLAGTDEDEEVELVITVLDRCEVVDGVRTRVVEERETVNGQLVEVSQNYLAIDPITLDTYYFGEDVDIYEDGQVVSHDGAWRSGVNGARFGLLMPGTPRKGMRFAQENAPGVAQDEASILGYRDDIRTPAGTFRKVLAVRESSPLDTSVSVKLHAKGVGLVKDGALRLVSVVDPNL